MATLRARAMLAGLASAGAASALATSAQAACADWDPLARPALGSARPVTARDMIELVNFGRPDAEPVGDSSPLGLSPDGRFAATILQRADLEDDGYCQALVVVDLTGRIRPRVLDRGGGFLMTEIVFRGMYIANGFPRLNAPAWSADGRSIAYLKRLDGRTQLWRARLHGGSAAMVTRAHDDVDRWTWSDGGRTLAYAFVADRAGAEAAIDREGRAGWHYDARMVPNAGFRPQIAAPLAQAEAAIDPETGITSAASDADHRLLAARGGTPPERPLFGAKGLSAWAASTGSSPLAERRLTVVDRAGRSLRCRVDACHGRFVGLWWSHAGDSLYALKREGWNDRYTALYRWRPGRGQLRRVLRTDDVIEGCRRAGANLVCIRQGATQPPRLVAIEPGTGHQTILFDPNPGFAHLSLGTVRRLEWRNFIGHEVYGDLVLPRGYTGGRLPTIVVQYSSRGLLRGGTGNEYPIQLFAQRGFAVLSIEKPAMAAADDPSLRTWGDVTRANTKDWAERRNTDSAIEEGVKLLVDMGIADPDRVGITGLSDGASAVRFALSNGRHFAAAAISSCCIDESSDDVIGPAWADYSAGIGYPPAAPVDAAFWQPYSLAINAKVMRTPLLMQLADFELLMGVHAYTALTAYHRPVDLYAFPGEYHIKWQPRHREAVFARSLDWFSFWLQGHEDPAPDKAGQFARWRAFRTARAEAETTEASVVANPVSRP